MPETTTKKAPWGITEGSWGTRRTDMVRVHTGNPDPNESNGVMLDNLAEAELIVRLVNAHHKRFVEDIHDFAGMPDGTIIRDAAGDVGIKHDWPLDLAVNYFGGDTKTNANIPTPIEILGAPLTESQQLLADGVAARAKKREDAEKEEETVVTTVAGPPDQTVAPRPTKGMTTTPRWRTVESIPDWATFQSTTHSSIFTKIPRWFGLRKRYLVHTDSDSPVWVSRKMLTDFAPFVSAFDET